MLQLPCAASAASRGPLLADEEDVEDTLGMAEADAAEKARQSGAKTTGKSASKRTRKTAEDDGLAENLVVTNEFLRNFVANPPSAPVRD